MSAAPQPDARPPLSADMHLPGVRWLVPGDAPLLIDLLRACYGYTYSHARLYVPAQLDALWASGELVSLGYVDDDGRLTGHTGFWTKDPRDEYVESGLSLVHPAARRGFPVPPGAMWRRLRNRWQQRVAFIHQHTTTRHARAQLYAVRYMGARPTGLVLDYALGETLVGLAENPAPMHALTMTTVLDPGPPQSLALPSGPWASWLEALIRRALPEARVQPVGGSPVACRLEAIEWSASLSLRRRGVVLSDRPGDLDDELRAPRRAGVRTDLVHVPMRPAIIAGAWPRLLEAGYVPVGIRPHRRRTTEIVLQLIEDRGRCARAAAEMALCGQSMTRLVDEWVEACERTS